jgi:RNA polymerase sigma factor (TIGR02999 family)
LNDITEATILLREGREGNSGSAARLFDLVYNELRSLAGAYLRRERIDHTLQPTALVHEAFVRLIDQQVTGWEDRTYFYGVAAQTMRRVLVDHARRVNSLKRGGDRARARIEIESLAEDPALLDLQDLDEALRLLERISPRRARVVELRFFGGQSIEQTAELLEVSISTIKREWDTARAWLLLQLSGSETDHD